MKDKKSTKIEVRLTPEEKEALQEYANERHITMSEAIRWMCESIFQKKK